MPSYGTTKLKLTTWVALIMAIMLFYAPFHKGDYDYYMLLRIVVTFATWFLILGAVSDWPDDAFFTIAYIITLILFQPFAMLSFSRKTWAWIDIVCGIIYLISFIKRANNELVK